MIRQRAFMLITCLMLAVVMLVVVLGMMGSRGPHQEATASLRHHLQALSLAEAGLENARAKLAKDVKFPPVPSPEQPYFSCSEAVYDIDNTVVGVFQVHIDQELEQAPYFVYRITSVGTLGDLARPLAQTRLYEEVDNCPFDRLDPAVPNPRRYQVLLREELP